MTARLPPTTSLLGGFLCLAVTACSTPASRPSDPLPLPEAFSAAGTVEAPDRWWTELENAGLSAAVDTALSANLDLLTAWERLREARAVADVAGAARWPALDASAGAGVTETSDAAEDEAGENGRDDGSSFTAELAASYELDLWGRIDSRVDAERFRAEATRADYHAAALSLSAEVVRTWSRLAEARRQVSLVEQQIETNRILLELLENRFGTGLVRAVDILRQRQLVEATREELTRARERADVLEHQFSVLLGRPPQRDPAFDPEALPRLPPLPATGLPLELVRRRPDVRAAFLRLRAADEDVAAAVSDQFPRLSLSASTLTESGTAAGLFESWVTSLAGNLLAPLFRGGELRAEVSRSRAVRQQRLYEYGQTTLLAFREVEDALARELRQRQRIERLEEQVRLAGQSSEQLRIQFLNGAGDYLDVLTATSELQALRRELLATRLTLVDTRIGLYRALAGSFETSREAG